MLSLFVNLAFAIVTVAIVASNKPKHIISLIVFSLCSDALGFRFLGPNILLYQLVGLLLLPRTIRSLPALVKRHTSMRLLVGYLFLMFALGVVFGHVLPWPDTSHERPWSQQAQGRSLISMTRHIADFSLLLYWAYAARRVKILPIIARALAIAIAANLLVAFVDHAFSVRLINFFAGMNEPVLARLGGLNGEPRALGRVCAIAMVFFMYSVKTRVRFIGSFLLCMLGLALAASTSALVTLAVCLGLGFAYSVTTRNFKLMTRFLIIPALAGLAFVLLWGGRLDKNVNSRLKKLSDAQEHAWGEPEWMSHLEVFDRAAMRFLWSNPEYMVFGTGPDLVSLPASDYIATVDREIYGYRIDSVPHTGVINILANGGFLGLILWALAIISASVR